MRFVFGLGNPGKKYEGTRHNAGFDVVDVLCTRLGVRLRLKPKLEVRAGDGYIGPDQVMLCEPQTFMNQSGYAVSAVLDYYRARPSDAIVVYDDIDLPFGVLRIRERGSAGTHNGMRSVVEYLGTEDFVRVRLGIGRPEGPAPLTSYVLGRFPDQDARREMAERAAGAVECIIGRGIQAAQQEFQEKRD